MIKTKSIEKQTAADGYQNGVADSKASLPKGYQNDPHYFYLLDKAKNAIHNHRKYPNDYPNPSAGLAYAFSAYVEPVLKIISSTTGDSSLEKATMEWFLNFWLPRAELELDATNLDLRAYGKNCKVADIFNNSIKAFETKLMDIENITLRNFMA